MPLRRDPSFSDPDRIYNTIIDAHRGLRDAESLALNASLVLLLANHIGDLDVSAGQARPRILAIHQRTPTKRKRQSRRNSGGFPST